MDYMTVADAARLLGKHEDTIRRWIKEGKLPAKCHPLTGRYSVATADVERMREKFEQENQG